MIPCSVIRLFLLFILTSAFASPAAADSSAAGDAGAIRQVALDYIEGWYEGDAARMERAVHPQLVKRLVEGRGGRSRLDVMNAGQLIEATRRGSGKRTPENTRRTDVRILDVFRGAASVRVDAHGWVDYMHLVRWNGEWKIINVLWETR